jgi:hypothetical protein
MEVVLDLAGKKLNWTNGDDDLITVNGGKLTIISSVAGGMITEPDGFIASVFGGELVLGQPSGDEGAYVLGELIADGGAITLVRGYLSSDFFEGESSLIDGMALAEGSALSADMAYDAEDNEYYVITCGATPEPEPTYTITVDNENTNASVTSDPATLTGLAAGTSVTITATAAEGFTYKGVEAEGWIVAQDGATATYTVTVNDNLEVTVPAAVPAAKEIEAGTTKSFDNIEAAEAATNGVVITVSSDDAAVGISAAYFKPVIKTIGNTFVVGVELDETVIQPSADDAAETFIENLATAEVDEHGKITIKFTGEQVKRGLKYGVAVSESLTGENSIQNATPATWETANANGVDLKVTKPTNGKGFFKVHIKYEPIKAAE